MCVVRMRVRRAELRWADASPGQSRAQRRWRNQRTSRRQAQESWGEASDACRERRAPDSPNPSANFTGRCQERGSRRCPPPRSSSALLGASPRLRWRSASVPPPPARPMRRRPSGTRSRKCESGGRWHINTGNGYYGGLQFSSSTWRAHGGKKYASKANKASRAEQIAIARRVLATQGRGAWPVCGRQAAADQGERARPARRRPPAPTRERTRSQQREEAPKQGSPASRNAKKARESHRRQRPSRSSAVTPWRKIAKRHHVKGGWKGLVELEQEELEEPE